MEGSQLVLKEAGVAGVLTTQDALYDGFVASLSPTLQPTGRELAHLLGLAPSGVPWSEVFSHPVTLAAPALVAEGMPDVPMARVRDATLAHMLGVIEAFGTDRVEDGQVRLTPELGQLLREVRRARDASQARVIASTLDPRTDFRRADERTTRAIATEREILQSGLAVSLETYADISLQKQSPGFPATIALAVSAGYGHREVRAIEQALASVWLGLQHYDDAVDWEDDYRRGGAWAASLAGVAGEGPSVRARVLESRVLEALLARSRRHFRAARRRFEELDARTLAAWAGQREAKVAKVLQAEHQSPGFVVRAHVLAPWAEAVLA